MTNGCTPCIGFSRRQARKCCLTYNEQLLLRTVEDLFEVLNEDKERCCCFTPACFPCCWQEEFSRSEYRSLQRMVFSSSMWQGDFRAHCTAAAGGSLPAKGVALGLLKGMVVELQEKMNEDGDPRNPLTKDEFIDAAAIALKDHAQNAARDLQAIITAQNAKEDAMSHGRSLRPTRTPSFRSHLSSWPSGRSRRSAPPACDSSSASRRRRRPRPRRATRSASRAGVAWWRSCSRGASASLLRPRGQR